MPSPKRIGKPNKEIRAKLGRTACNNLAMNTARMGTGVASRKSMSPERYKACNNTPKLVNNVPTNRPLNVNAGMVARNAFKSTPTYCANSGERMRPSNIRLIDRIKIANPNNINQIMTVPILRLNLACLRLL